VRHLRPVWLYYRGFSTLSHKRHDFRKTITEHKICVLIFYTNLPATFHIIRRIPEDNTMKIRKVPIFFFFSDFKRAQILYKYSNIKFCEKRFSRSRNILMRTDRQADGLTDVTTLKVASRNSAHAPKNGLQIHNQLHDVRETGT
jgi:hypothetical protein